MHTIHYDNGFGLAACGISAIELTRNPDHVGCYHCENLVPALSPYQLPSGEVVAIRTDVARGAETVSFAVVSGEVVDARRYEVNR